MRPVSFVRGTMLPLDRADVDTDQIIPQQFLKRTERSGYGRFLFYNWAHDESGQPIPEFVLNRPEYRDARVLITGPNFGCGSSREHAAWALQDWGFEAIVAPSVADIFRNNCYQIGLLVVDLPPDRVAEMIEIASDPRSEIQLDLRSQTVACGELRATFEIEPSVKRRLLAGMDTIDVTLRHEEAIAAHEANRPDWMPTLTDRF